MGPNPMTGVLLREKLKETQIYHEKIMKTEQTQRIEAMQKVEVSETKAILL